jgi:DNA-binding XRE family transcriptional regulator
MLFKEFLKKNRYNYNTLAEKLGVSRITIASWDNGVTSPTIKQVSDLCRLLDVEPDEIINNYIKMKGGKEINVKK